MSLVSRLIDFVSDAVGARPGAPDALDGLPDERLAAAALLVHVARVDGRIVETERARLEGFAAAAFGLGPDAAARLVTRADAVDRETDGLSGLVERMGHDLDPEGRRRLLGAAYEVAAADGRLHEFEEDLVWRLGRLLGLQDPDIQAIRDAAVPSMGAAAGAAAG
jgi:uncharacterized tellurite resistance protein B-like protein